MTKSEKYFTLLTALDGGRFAIYGPTALARTDLSRKLMFCHKNKILTAR